MAVEEYRCRQVGEMFERNQGYIDTTARFFTGSPQDAEDVSQNVAEHLLTTRRVFRGEADERTFLFAAVRNTAGMLRRANRRVSRGGGQVVSLEGFCSGLIPASPSAEDVAIRGETIRQAKRNQFVALRLEGYTFGQIAAMTHKREAAVKSSVRRCLKSLE